MNIFRLDDDPETCARFLEDGHINSHILENALMLSTALREHGYADDDSEADDYLYGSTHVNHPSTQWVMEKRGNFQWLYWFTKAVYKEKQKRYGGSHNSWTECVSRMPQAPTCLPVGTSEQPVVGGATEFFDAETSVVEAYRANYVQSNRRYDNGRKKPDWFDEYRTKYAEVPV